MLIKICEFEFTECWDGVLYKKLSDYPKITDWEIQTVLDFIRYESEYDRTCEIEAEGSILHAIDTYRASYEKSNRVTPPEKITECRDVIETLPLDFYCDLADQIKDDYYPDVEITNLSVSFHWPFSEGR